MFYSPFERCHICRQYVLLDQTKKECATEHECLVAQCPLEQFFAEGYAHVPIPKPQPGPQS